MNANMKESFAVLETYFCCFHASYQKYLEQFISSKAAPSCFVLRIRHKRREEQFRELSFTVPIQLEFRENLFL